jgi:hypothetical protein
MKKNSKVIYKRKTKYNKRIKYFKLPLINNQYIDNNEDINLKYDIDNINIHSFKIVSKQYMFMGLILFSGIFYFML